MEKNESPPMYPVVPVLNDVSGGPDTVYFGVYYTWDTYKKTLGAILFSTL